MKHIITLLNKKSGTGKTTIGLNIAAILSDALKLKTGFLDYNEAIYDTELYAGVKKSHLYSAEKNIDDYLPAKDRFSLLWAGKSKFGEVIKKFNDKLDILIIDTDGITEEIIFEISDRIIIPTAMTALDIKYAQYTVQRLLDLKFQSSLFNIIVNKNTNNFIIIEHMQEVFKETKVQAILPFVKEIEDCGSRGEIYYYKNKKSAFIKSLQASVEAIIATMPSTRPYIELLEKYADKTALEEKTTEPQLLSKEPAMVAVKSSVKVEKTDKYSSLRKAVHNELFEEIDIKNLERDALVDPEKKKQMFDNVMAKIRSILDRMDNTITDRSAREVLAKDIFNEVTGLGIIEDMLVDREISEIMVNKYNEVYVEKKGRLTLYDKKFTDEKTVRRVIERIVMPLGRRIDESQPYVDARLPDGSRVNAIIPPLAIDGSVLTIRKFSDRKLTSDDLVKYGSITPEAAEYLKAAVAGKKNILISGGTGSGKTTLLNVLSSFIPEDERILTIEDSAELKLNQEHVVRLESRPANIEGRGEVTIRDLVRNALRMRPDRIVVGECRGGETLDMLQAMNTGHEGSMTTLHSNSPRDALSRMEVMVLMAGVDLPVKAIREQIKSAIDIIVQQSRLKDGTRKVTYISELTGMEGDTILMHNVFEFNHEGIDDKGYIIGKLKRTDRLSTGKK